MAKPSDDEERRKSLQDRLIGLGESSFRKSYYPQLQSRLEELERFRRLLDSTLDAILLVALPSERIVDANAAACRQLGYSREELLTRSLAEVVDLERLRWPREPSQGGAAKMVSTVLRCRNGSEVPVEVDLSMDDFGESPYGIVVARDISERLQAEASLRKSEWEKGLILESTEELVIYFDTEMRITWANRMAVQIAAHLLRPAGGTPLLGGVASAPNPLSALSGARGAADRPPLHGRNHRRGGPGLVRQGVSGAQCGG